MVSEWYLKVADRVVGPLTSQQLKAMANQGQIATYDPVRLGSDGRWVPARSVRGLFATEKPSTVQRPSNGLPVAEELKQPPAVPMAERADEAKHGAAAPNTEPTPPVAPVASPASAPPSTPPGDPPGIPVARAVDPGPPPPPSAQTAPGPVAVEAGDDAPPARHAGRASGAHAGPRRRRRQEAILVTIIMAVLALGTLTAVVMLSRKGPSTPSASFSIPEDVARNAEPVEEEVVIPGLEEYLGGTAPESPDGAESETPAPKPETPVAEPKRPVAEEWTDASTSPIECGDVRVGVTSARIGRPELVSAEGSKAVPTKDYLCLKLELHNRSKAEKREFRSWGHDEVGATLVDDRDHAYALRSFADQGYAVLGQVDGGSGVLSSGGAMRDFVVFDKPRDGVSLLRLELPAAAFGEEGSLKFEIPISMIAVSERTREAPSRSAAKRGESETAEQAGADAESDDGPIAIPGIHDGQGGEPEQGADDFRFAEDPDPL